MSSNNAFKKFVVKSAPSLTEANFPELSVSVSNIIKPSLTQWASIAATPTKSTVVTVEEFSQEKSEFVEKMNSTPFDYAKWYKGMHREVGYADYFSEAYLEEDYDY
jgi:hypothetical protein